MMGKLITYHCLPYFCVDAGVQISRMNTFHNRTCKWKIISICIVNQQTVYERCVMRISVARVLNPQKKNDLLEVQIYSKRTKKVSPQKGKKKNHWLRFIDLVSLFVCRIDELFLFCVSETSISRCGFVLTLLETDHRMCKMQAKLSGEWTKERVRETVCEKKRLTWLKIFAKRQIDALHTYQLLCSPQSLPCNCRARILVHDYLRRVLWYLHCKRLRMHRHRPEN